MSSRRPLMPHLLGSSFSAFNDHPQDFFGLDFGLPAPDEVTESGLESITGSPQNFSVSLDVHHFRPEELSVKHIGNEIVVNGCHEEKSDPHGFVTRSFTRRYTLPEDVDIEQVACKYDSNVLSILGPKKSQKALDHHERVIPINSADQQPSLAQVGADHD